MNFRCLVRYFDTLFCEFWLYFFNKNVQEDIYIFKKERLDWKSGYFKTVISYPILGTNRIWLVFVSKVFLASFFLGTSQKLVINLAKFSGSSWNRPRNFSLLKILSKCLFLRVNVNILLRVSFSIPLRCQIVYKTYLLTCLFL